MSDKRKRGYKRKVSMTFDEGRAHTAELKRIQNKRTQAKKKARLLDLSSELTDTKEELCVANIQLKQSRTLFARRYSEKIARGEIIDSLKEEAALLYLMIEKLSAESK